jgi:LacI family transcriptional regulator
VLSRSFRGAAFAPGASSGTAGDRTEDQVRRPSKRFRTKVTIEDVAQRAGVSAMTVSRVVNAEKNVHPATRELVLSIVQELNYAPNLAARSLAKADDMRIGLIYSNPSAAYLSEFLVGALDESTSRGAQLVLVKCEGFDVGAAEQAVQQLIEGGVTGVVLTPPVSELHLVIDRLRAAGVASVAVATGRFQGDLTCVRVDERRAAYDMTKLLLRLGHRRIGLIKGHPNQTASAERLAGFEAAMAEKPGCKFVTAQGFFTFGSGLEAAEHLLESPLRPTAIFASNDDMAAATVSVAHRRGLDVPNDLSVVGFDDTAVATTVWPALTTVRQPVSEMSGRAIELLVQEIRARRDGETPEPIDCVIEHTIVERHSSAPPRAAARQVR